MERVGDHIFRFLDIIQKTIRRLHKAGLQFILEKPGGAPLYDRKTGQSGNIICEFNDLFILFHHIDKNILLLVRQRRPQLFIILLIQQKGGIQRRLHWKFCQILYQRSGAFFTD